MNFYTFIDQCNEDILILAYLRCVCPFAWVYKFRSVFST